MSSESITILILVIIAFLAIGVSVILAYQYFSQKGQISRQIHMAQELWREKELGPLRETAQKESLAQLQQWREQELELARKQQLETARSEAQVEFEHWKVEYTQGIRQDAIQKSQAVTVGKVTEHFVPYLPEFTYNPKDARFIGSPIDFVIFDGLDNGSINCVVFAEVKTGSSALSTRERQIRDAVRAGKVQWVEIRPQLAGNSDNASLNEEQNAPIIAPVTETEKSLQPEKDKESTRDRLRLIMKEQ